MAKECPSRRVPDAAPAVSAKLVRSASTEQGSESFLQVTIRKGSNTLSISAVLDTGCAMSVLPAKYCFVKVQPTDIKLFAANNTQLTVTGKACVEFMVGDLRLKAEVLVTPSCDEFLLSQNWLRENHCVWHFATATVYIQGRAVKLQQRQSSINVRRVVACENLLIEKRSITDVPVKLA